MKWHKGQITIGEKIIDVKINVEPKKRMQFSKKIVIFASVVYAVILTVCVVSWFMYREYPVDFKENATWLYGAALAFYNAKACIENKCKIDINKDDAHYD